MYIFIYLLPILTVHKLFFKNQIVYIKTVFQK